MLIGQRAHKKLSADKKLKMTKWNADRKKHVSVIYILKHFIVLIFLSRFAVVRIKCCIVPRIICCVNYFFETQQQKRKKRDDEEQQQRGHIFSIQNFSL